MKTQKCIWYFLLSILFGCNENKTKIEEKNYISINVDYHNVAEAINDSEIIDTIQFIKLEDTDELIGEIKKLIVTDHEYIIFDQQRKWVWLFETTGKYRARIDNFGNGPNEYRSAHNISFSAPDQINILDNAQRCILTYNTKGEYVKKTLLDYYAADYYSSKSSTYALFYYIPDNVSPKRKFYLQKLNSHNGKMEKGFFQYKNCVWNLDDDFFIMNREEYYFHKPYNDTIYKINDKMLTRSYVFNFGENSFPYHDINNASKSDQLVEILKRGYFQGNIRNILISDSFIILKYAYQRGQSGQIAYLQYNLKTKRILNFKSIIKDKLDVLIDYPMATDGEYFYTITQPYYFSENALTKHPNIGSTITSNSNPIISKYKYKQ